MSSAPTIAAMPDQRSKADVVTGATLQSSRGRGARGQSKALTRSVDLSAVIPTQPRRAIISRLARASGVLFEERQGAGHRVAAGGDLHPELLRQGPEPGGKAADG